MLIKDLFKKPIDRNINGVIVVDQDDEEEIKQELAEYVVTDELLEHFADFFKVYSNAIENPTYNTGVWISGFFGSGKSHFLKILSYILSNNLEIDGKKPIDYFINDKISKETIIKDMEKSVKINNTVVLFNVSSKSSNDDSILDVFNKVFNQIRGYSSNFLSKIEKKLDDENKFTEFKEVFKEISGDSWENVRENLDNFKDLKKALKKSGYIDTYKEFDEWLDHHKELENLTPESFALDVKKFSQENNTNVLFFIDEMGQYLSNNVDSMLQLQTIVEQLAIKCKGKAWIIVTSQDKLKDFQFGKKSNFSAIQGRFKTRISLSSSSVDEVIKIRILEKNEDAKKELSDCFKEYGQILKNKINFMDSSEMKNYSNEADFIDNYPLIPYQFNLLQRSLIEMRKNSDSNSDMSSGERSMIDVIHQTVKNLRNNSIEILIPFNDFYDPLHNLFDSKYNFMINTAKKNDNLNDFDLDILKALLLIKYVPDDFLKPTLDNISTLMISSINQNKIELKNSVESSLERLIKEVFVYKKGDFYYFLTNEEQSVNKEILNQNVDEKEITKFLFDNIKHVLQKKFEPKLNYSFGVGLKIDDLKSKENKLGISVLTSYYDEDDFENENYLKNLSNDTDNVILRLYEDNNLFKEIIKIKKIDNYLSKKQTSITTQIECEKREELKYLKEGISDLINESILNSKIYIKGNNINDIKISSNNIDEFFNEVLKKLFNNIYRNFYYLDSEYGKEDIIKAINEFSQETLVKAENSSLALDELEKTIFSKDSININDIFSKFESAPYGFKKYDISWLIAKLFSQKRISLFINDIEIFIEKDNHQKIYDYVTRKNEIDSKNLYLSKKEKISSEKIRSVNHVYDLLVNKKGNKDPKILMDEFKEVVDDKIFKIDEICKLIYRDDRYPGKNILEKNKKCFSEIKTKNKLIDFFTFVYENEKKLIIHYEDLTDVFNFYDSNQKLIFDKSLSVIENFEDNLENIEDNNIIEIINKINEIINEDLIFSKVPNLKTLNEGYCQKILELLNNIKNPILDRIEKDEKNLSFLIENNSDKIDDDYKNKLFSRYSNYKSKIGRSIKIFEINGLNEDYKNFYKKSSDEINEFLNKKNEPESYLDLGSILDNELIVSSEEELEELLDIIGEKIKNELKTANVVKIK